MGARGGGGGVGGTEYGTQASCVANVCEKLPSEQRAWLEAQQTSTCYDVRKQSSVFSRLTPVAFSPQQDAQEMSRRSGAKLRWWEQARRAELTLKIDSPTMQYLKDLQLVANACSNLSFPHRAPLRK